MVLSGCLEDNPPTLTPYLYVPDELQNCGVWIIDPKTLIARKDHMAPCSDIEYGLPKGQLQSELAWARREIKSCEEAKAKLQQIEESLR